VVVLGLIKSIMAMFQKRWTTEVNIIGHEQDLKWKA